MRTLALIGVPGVGKTTFMKALLASLGGITKIGRLGLCDFGIVGPGVSYIVLGKYEEGEIFAGTDRLSMNVIDDAKRLITSLSISPDSECTVMYEGDRLSNGAFLRHCAGNGDLRVVILKIKPELLAQRRAGRSAQAGKTQDAKWLAGRESKVYNLETSFSAEVIWIDEVAQFDAGVDEMSRWVKGEEVLKSVAKKPTRLF